MRKIKRICKGERKPVFIRLNAELVKYARSLYPDMTLSAILELAIYMLLASTIQVQEKEEEEGKGEGEKENSSSSLHSPFLPSSPSFHQAS